MKITGYASTADMDHARHVVVPSAFVESIRDRGIEGPSGVKLLVAHQSDKPVGGITKLEPRNSGLWIEAEVEEGISYGKDIALAIKAAGGLSFSIGFYVIDADVDVDASGNEFLRILKGNLTEVSIVVFPCNEAAKITAYG